MELIGKWIQSALDNILPIGIIDIIDIIIVAYLIYKLITLLRFSSAFQVIKGIFFLLLIMWASGILGLNMLHYILQNGMQLGFLALLIMFQPELRRFLEKFGSQNLRSLLKNKNNIDVSQKAIGQMVEACSSLSDERCGALIVIERSSRLDDYIKTGTMINADVSAELLKNIFYPKAPLHDGAVIIRYYQIASAGCILPLSSNVNLSRDLGMRHRAGIGMSETNDSLVIIVSEETGTISVAVNGMLKRHLAPETLERLLYNELIENPKTEKSKGLLHWFKAKKLER